MEALRPRIVGAQVYYVLVHLLAQRVLDYVQRQELLTPGDRVGVAVSGGADSVGLLRLLLDLRSELGIILSVVHLNHKLRGAESDADQQFVADLARAHDLDFHPRDIEVAQFAADEHLSLETAARQCRYNYFEDLLTTADVDQSLDKIATGHTLDDQAETVLLRLVRGTGLRGLRAIQPRIVVGDDNSSGEVIRPLLWIRRHELQQYLGSLGQPWREDATNADPRFSRNRVRHVLLPLLESEFNPAVAENLADLAEIAREEEDYWDNEVAGWMGTAVQRFAPEWSQVLQPSSQPLVQIQQGPNPSPDEQLMEKMQEPGTAVVNASISLGWLLSEPIAVQRRVTKAVTDDLGLTLDFKHVEAILRFAAEENGTGKQLTLPLGWTVLRERDSLVFTTPGLREQERTPDFEYVLPVPGAVSIPETYSTIEVLRIPAAEQASWSSDDLFDPALLPRELVVRNWRPGDRFWPAHTKAPKKLKDLLQEKHLPRWRKKSWPVVLRGDEIVWVRGFPARAQFRPAEGQPAIAIREVPLDSTEP